MLCYVSYSDLELWTSLMFSKINNNENYKLEEACGSIAELHFLPTVLKQVLRQHSLLTDFSLTVQALEWNLLLLYPRHTCKVYNAPNMTINQLAVKQEQDHCRSQRCYSDIVPCPQTDRQGNGYANGLSVRLFQLSCSPSVELYRARLPLPLKLCLALVQSNYHLLVEGSLQQYPAAPAPHLRSSATLFWTLRDLSHFSRPRISAHYAKHQTSWVIASPAWWEYALAPGLLLYGHLPSWLPFN